MTHEEKKQKIAELEKQLEELKNMPTGWKPKLNDYYYFINSSGEIDSNLWKYDSKDSYRFDIGNCFETKKEAEEYKKKIKMQADYKTWCEEYSEPIDWNDSNQQKFKAVYDNIDKEIHICADYYVLYQGGVYASSKEIIQDFIDKVGEKDFIKYVLEVEE